MSKQKSKWVINPAPKLNATARLFCFPYGGGSAHVFNSWSSRLPSWIDVCSVQAPGRGDRLSEPPFTNLNDLVNVAAGAVKPFLDLPFAFFGHSIGALISFELSRCLRRRFGVQPFLLLVSGSRAPQICYQGTPFFDLPETQFLAEVERLNGIPKEVLQHSELMQIMTPLLRADFSLDQTYLYKNDQRLSCPIIAFGGLDDVIVNRASLEAWNQQTTASFSAKLFPGDHFFINTATPSLLESISSSISSTTVRRPAEINDREIPDEHIDDSGALCV